MLKKTAFVENYLKVNFSNTEELYELFIRYLVFNYDSMPTYKAECLTIQFK